MEQSINFGRSTAVEFGELRWVMPTVDIKLPNKILHARRRRCLYFGNLFGEPAWDMLLELYSAFLEQRRISVSSLCIASAVPATTALRHIGYLEKAGLLTRRGDPLDRRRVFVALTATALEALGSYFRWLTEKERAI